MTESRFFSETESKGLCVHMLYVYESEQSQINTTTAHINIGYARFIIYLMDAHPYCALLQITLA